MDKQSFEKKSPKCPTWGLRGKYFSFFSQIPGGTTLENGGFGEGFLITKIYFPKFFPSFLGFPKFFPVCSNFRQMIPKELYYSNFFPITYSLYVVLYHGYVSMYKLIRHVFENYT